MTEGNRNKRQKKLETKEIQMGHKGEKKALGHAVKVLSWTR